MMLGCDVSAYQGATFTGNNSETFVIIKATEGTGYVSSKLKSQTDAARRENKRVGFYHFPHYSNSPTVEADFFCNTVASVFRSGDRVFLDHEASNPPSPQHASIWAQNFLGRVVHRFSRPGVYSNLYFAMGGFCKNLGGYDWWAAYYNNRPGNVGPHGPFKSVSLHQYSSSPYDRDWAIDTYWDVSPTNNPNPNKETDLSAMVSLGISDGLVFESGSDKPVALKEQYSDNHHYFHVPKGEIGYSLFPDGNYWAICSVFFVFEGGTAGQKAKISLVRYTKDKAGKWQYHDTAWWKTVMADETGVIENDMSAQFGVNSDIRLRWVVHNLGQNPLHMTHGMWKTSFLTY